ncbi:MAG: ABC transporter permease [Erysipelothrix sp.]|nr:ABC transporter permease [Erysipelothrix sp.]
MIKVGRLIKEGFIGVFRHFALAFSSMSTIAITLFLMSLFMLLNQNIINITNQIENNVSLYVQISDETLSENIPALQKEIMSVDGVAEIKFSSKHEELDYFIENRGEEGEELFGAFRGDENPFLDTFIVNIKTGESIKAVAEGIDDFKEIHSVTYGGEATQSLLKMMEQVRNVGFIFVIILGFVAIFLISNTIGATINSRNEEIAIMRTVGATNWYIRWPFIIEGIIIGVLGSILPVIITIYGYTSLFGNQTFNLDSMFNLIEPFPMVTEIALMIVISGALVGAFGSLLSVSRRLRWTR